MQIERLPNDMLEVINNSNGLKQYLNNLLKGRAATPRSWLYETESDTEVLRKWMSILETIRDTPRGEEVYQFDTSQLKKWGPQGKVAPIGELMDLVTEGFSSVSVSPPAIFKSPKWIAAKQMAIKMLTAVTGYHALTPRSYAKVLDDMSSRDTLESNSGWPLFTRRNKPEVIEAALHDIQTGAYKEYPAIVLFRNYNQKTRPVWMYPLSTNIVEGSFTQPLKEAIMRSNLEFFAPWRGYDHVLRHVTDMYDSGAFLAASDFSHTDAYFTKWKMLEVYDVIRNCFQEKYWDALKDSMLRVTSIPLIIGPDKWITGDHGVSSGSNWTNDCETYLDLIAECYFVICSVVTKLGNAIGDDVLHASERYNPDLAAVISELYGQMDFDVNEEKVTNFEDRVKYLQRLVIRGYRRSDSDDAKLVYGPKADSNYLHNLRGIYSTIRALNSSLHPEKFHSPKLWSYDMFATRQTMICENCVDHPLFVKWCKFIAAGNEKLVDWAKQKDAHLDDAYRQSRLVPGLNPTYNQEKRDKPLSEFATIRIWRSL